MDYSNDETLQSIRLRSNSPDAGDPSDSDLLLLLNEEAQSWLVPLIMREKAEYLTTTLNVPLVSGQNIYPIPSQAVAGHLRLLQLLDTSGQPQLPPLTQIDPRDEGPTYASTWGTFFVRGDSIVLLGTISAGWTLRITYVRRPSECVVKSACAQITALNFATNAVTVTAFPATFTTGVSVDFVKGGSSWQTAGTLSMPTPSGLTATFTGTLPSNLAVGDWLCLAGQAPFCQVPQECVPVLRQWLCCKVLEIAGDDALQASTAVFARAEAAMRSVLAPRVDGNLKLPNGILGRRGGFSGGQFGGY